MLNKLAATQSELEAINKVEEQHFGVVNLGWRGGMTDEGLFFEHLLQVRHLI